MVRICVDGHAPFVACLAGHEAQDWLESFDRGDLDVELRVAAARAPRRRLRRVPRNVRRRQRSMPVSVGIEHEFEVRNDLGAVDVRSLWAGMNVSGVRADPTDPHATRLAGCVVTLDGREAEYATAPVRVKPGFVDELAGLVAVARRELTAALPPGHWLVGVSTHINVSLTTRRDDRFARRWAELFAPSLMLLLDGPQSPGLLVRPRPGRLELGGEYSEGAPLAAAVAFAVGSVLALEQVGPRTLRRLRVGMDVVPAVARYGWYIDRCAMGDDLYALGRATTLRRVGGEAVPAAQHLLETATLARAAFGPEACDDDLRALDAVIACRQRLPSEVPVPERALS